MHKRQEIPQKSGIKWSMVEADIYVQKSIHIYRERPLMKSGAKVCGGHK